VSVFAVAAWLVSDQTFLVGETAVLRAANDLPGWIGSLLRVVMELGTAVPFLTAVGVVAWCTRRDGPSPALAVLLAFVGARLHYVWKEVIERPRPAGLVEGLHLREHARGFGFPSGHTTMACALAAVLHPLLPRRTRWVAWVLALAVGVARMHVGAHWPMDVVGGVALGVAIASAAWMVVGRGYGRRRP